MCLEVKKETIVDYSNLDVWKVFSYKNDDNDGSNIILNFLFMTNANNLLIENKAYEYDRHDKFRHGFTSFKSLKDTKQYILRLDSNYKLIIVKMEVPVGTPYRLGKIGKYYMGEGIDAIESKYLVPSKNPESFIVVSDNMFMKPNSYTDYYFSYVSDKTKFNII